MTANDAEKAYHSIIDTIYETEFLYAFMRKLNIRHDLPPHSHEKAPSPFGTFPPHLDLLLITQSLAEQSNLLPEIFAKIQSENQKTHP